MWGYAVNLAGSSSGEFVFDDVLLYGTATPTVAVESDVYLVNPGGVATVGVQVRQPGNGPIGAPVTVTYTAGGGTAVAGTDYTAVTGTLTFPAGTPSGTVKTFTVQTTAGTPASVAKTIPIALTATGANVSATAGAVVINAHGLPYLDPKLPVKARVADLLSRMSLADKVGQMTQAERGAVGSGGATSPTGSARCSPAAARCRRRTPRPPGPT